MDQTELRVVEPEKSEKMMLIEEPVAGTEYVPTSVVSTVRHAV